MNLKALSLACVISLSTIAAAGCADNGNNNNGNNGNNGNNAGNQAGTTTGQSTRGARTLGTDTRGGTGMLGNNNGTVRPYSTQADGQLGRGTRYGSNGNRLFENDFSDNNTDSGRMFGVNGPNGRNTDNDTLFGRGNNNNGDAGLFGNNDMADRDRNGNNNDRGGLFGTGLFSGMMGDNDNGNNNNNRRGNGHDGIRSNGAGTSDGHGIGMNSTTGGQYGAMGVNRTGDENTLVLGETVIVADNNNIGYPNRMGANETNNAGTNGIGVGGMSTNGNAMNSADTNGANQSGRSMTGNSGQTRVLRVSNPQALKALKRLHKNLESGQLSAKAEEIAKDLRSVLQDASDEQVSKSNNNRGANNNRGTNGNNKAASKHEWTGTGAVGGMNR